MEEAGSHNVEQWIGVLSRIVLLITIIVHVSLQNSTSEGRQAHALKGLQSLNNEIVCAM